MQHIYKQGKSDAPVLVLLHGTGGNENSLMQLAPILNEDSSILSIRGEVNENGALRFFKRKAEGIYDVEDLFYRGKLLREFIEKCSREYNFSLENVVFVGFSNGSNIAINLLLEHSDYFKKGILFAPLYPLNSENNNLESTNIFISTGNNDPITPVKESDHIEQMFLDKGASVTRFYVNSHEITPQSLSAAKEWLENQF
ncbi:alpha/beta hydrolase [Gemelliphila palaticanis]|uniref:Alpha/beta hydrolase n=1 Tax=Gemelliphila palaticanis TaxID=81950 RepID=A0ABX2T3A2_9BACL|nr:alpha/beta hydrolase [Gemella palaticanis]MBF0715571.1 alpha/beta hydrolase [Gemella palaticanis]NYS47501.1 alpha/beta hydrolase [Gemella palaticanis]